MTELDVVKKYSKICYDYNSAIWFDDTLYEDWPNIAIILTDEQYESPEFSEDGSVLDLYIVGRTGDAMRGYFGPYNLVTSPGKRIVYSNLKYKYTVKIN